MRSDRSGCPQCARVMLPAQHHQPRPSLPHLPADIEEATPESSRSRTMGRSASTRSEISERSSAPCISALTRPILFGLEKVKEPMPFAPAMHKQNSVSYTQALRRRWKERNGISCLSGPSWSEMLELHHRYKAKHLASCFHSATCLEFIFFKATASQCDSSCSPSKAISLVKSPCNDIFLLSRDHVFQSQPTEAPEAVSLLHSHGEDPAHVLSVRGELLAVCDDTGREVGVEYNCGGNLHPSLSWPGDLSSEAGCGCCCQTLPVLYRGERQTDREHDGGLE